MIIFLDLFFWHGRLYVVIEELVWLVTRAFDQPGARSFGRRDISIGGERGARPSILVRNNLSACTQAYARAPSRQTRQTRKEREAERENLTGEDKIDSRCLENMTFLFDFKNVAPLNLTQE